MTITEALRYGAAHLADVSATAALDAQVLLAHVLAVDKTYLYTWPERLLGEQEEATYRQLIERRGQHEPVAYITGHREFWSLDLIVTPDTLIPRPETELLVELALERLPETSMTSAIDLGTGTGAIALALASSRPQAQITAIDNSAAALAVAKRNAEHHQLSNVSFLKNHWLQGLSLPRQDVIVSNPPYIDASDPHLLIGDLPYEPSTALVADDDGYADIKTIIAQAPQMLKKNGWLLFEHGYQQAEIVAVLLEKAGFSAVKSYSDLANLPRVSAGQLTKIN